MLRIGLISDTHGLLRPEAVSCLHGSAHIVHAGDIGDATILDALRALGPLTAVRGNNDIGAWADAVPAAALVELGGLRLHVVHDIADLALDLGRERIDVLVTGHSHMPLVAQHDGVLHVNPGSAGRRRFNLPVSVGELRIERGQVTAHLHTLGAHAVASKSRTGR